MMKNPYVIALTSMASMSAMAMENPDQIKADNLIEEVPLLARATENPIRPNILFILADDLGYADLSVHGCTQFETPHIDSIFNNGMRFSQAYVSNTVCAPSRAGLITGRRGSEFGFEANLPAKAHNPDSTIGLDPEQKTMGDVLKAAGYKTYCLGKWHLGYNKELFHPNKRGFDEFIGMMGGARSYWPLKKIHAGNSFQHNGEYVEEGEDFYVTDYLTDKAMDFIQVQKKENPKQPFFMFLSYTAPHHPMHAKESDLARVQHIPLGKGKHPDWRRIYAAMMLSLDDNVGRLLAFLDEQELTENTLIFFLSDNGGPLHKNGSDNGILRDRKGSLFEGGMRVPYGVQWAGTIEPGQVSDQQVSSLDLLPTFAAVSGADQNIEFETDGIDLMPLLSGLEKTLAPRPFFWRRNYTDDICIRRGKYKYVKKRGADAEFLFNIDEDISEKENLAASHPEILSELSKEFASWEATIPAPTFTSDWREYMKKKNAQKARDAKQHK